ncbi:MULTISPECIES: histidinol-phosphatase [Rhodomicrobium]|uniref:histidinol-phosphatase n=1 Tax=Rhodomicrobium TaxID=1068 RepID=UPI000B4A95B5|nr:MULTISPECIES: histidinol-phosphatase [Rhodomicrobium]
MTGVTVTDDFVSFAHKLADLAGDVIRPHFRARGAIDNKLDVGFDPVTEADRGAEQVMRRQIEQTFPSHGILGEEFDDKPAAGPYRWVLDPIDGTKAFILGLPTWGTLIGLTHEGVPLLGMMDQPYTGERFWNSLSGAHFRGSAGEQLIETRPCASLSGAVLAATTPDMFKGDEPGRFGSLSRSCRMTRFGSDCYAYCMLAMGFVDIVAEASLKPFDIAPLIPIIHAAGGKVTTWDGGDPAQGGQILAVGDPSLHEAAMRALAG